MTQSIQGEDLVRPLKPKHGLALQLLQKAADQNDGEAMRMLAMLTLYQQKSFTLEKMGHCIELLQKAYYTPDIPEESQVNIKNILCAFKVLAGDGVIELKSDEITLVTEEEIQELKERLKEAPEYLSLLNESQTEDDESAEEEMPFLHSKVEQTVEMKEETKEPAKEVKTDAPHDTLKKINKSRNKRKKSLINNTQTTTSTSSTTNIGMSSDSEQEPLSNKERKLREGFEKKNMKWRKVMKLMNLSIKIAGEGSMQPGKGSGTAIQVGESKTNVHKPHGRNSTNTEAGRMKSLGKIMNPVIGLEKK